MKLIKINLYYNALLWAWPKLLCRLTCGMSHVWMNQEGENMKWLKENVDRRLNDQFIQIWSQELKDM